MLMYTVYLLYKYRWIYFNHENIDISSEYLVREQSLNF